MPPGRAGSSARRRCCTARIRFSRSDPCRHRFGSVAGICTPIQCRSVRPHEPSKGNWHYSGCLDGMTLVFQRFLRSEPRKSVIPGLNRRNLVKLGLGALVSECGSGPVCRPPGRARPRGGLSGSGPGGEGFAAVPLQALPGFGEALRLAAVGEDHCERNEVEAGPVGRAMAGAGPAGVFAQDAIPWSMVPMFHGPVAPIPPEPILRRPGLGSQ